jgi:hypothetical protein
MRGVGVPAASIASVEATRYQDNTKALRFYQRRGMRLVAVHRGAVDRSRQIKASIPTVGHDGIPISDEIELELVLPDAEC